MMKSYLILLMCLLSTSLIAQTKRTTDPLKRQSEPAFTFTVGVGIGILHFSKKESLGISSNSEELGASFTTKTEENRSKNQKESIALSLSAGYKFHGNFSLGLTSKFIPSISYQTQIIYSQRLSTNGFLINSFGILQQKISGNVAQFMVFGNYRIPFKKSNGCRPAGIRFQSDVGVSLMTLTASVPYLLLNMETSTNGFTSFTALSGGVDPDKKTIPSFTTQISSMVDFYHNQSLFFQLGVGFGFIGQLNFYERDPDFTSILNLNANPSPNFEMYRLNLQSNNAQQTLFSTEIFLRFNVSRRAKQRAQR